jgi:hypothetical protein
MLALSRQESEAQAKVEELSQRLKVTREAVIDFFHNLDENQVPPEQLANKLAEIAEHYKKLLSRLAALDPKDPVTMNLVENARAAINAARYNQAERLLSEAEATDSVCTPKRLPVYEAIGSSSQSNRLTAQNVLDGKTSAGSFLGYRAHSSVNIR